MDKPKYFTRYLGRGGQIDPQDDLFNRDDLYMDEELPGQMSITDYLLDDEIDI